MAPPSQQPSILVADDDPILRSLIVAKLKSTSFKILEAADGMQAWQLIRGGDVRLALLDIEMPGMNGISLVQCIRSFPDTKHMPIVMITSRDDQNSLKRCLEAGASSYLTKPINWSLFSDHVDHLLRLAQGSEGLRQRAETAERLLAASSATLDMLQGELRTRPRELARTAQACLRDDGAGPDALFSELDAQRHQMARLAKLAALIARMKDENMGPVSLRCLFDSLAQARSATRPVAAVEFPECFNDITVAGYMPAWEVLGGCVLDLAGDASNPIRFNVEVGEAACLQIAIRMNDAAAGLVSDQGEGGPRTKTSEQLLIETISQIALLHGGEVTWKLEGRMLQLTLGLPSEGIGTYILPSSQLAVAV